MSATIITLHARAIDVLAKAAAQAAPGSALIVDSATGSARAHPRGVPIPPGWYRIGAGIKERAA